MAAPQFRPAHIVFENGQGSECVRSLPELVQYNYRNNPTHTFAIQAGETDSHHLRHDRVTHAQLGAATLVLSPKLSSYSISALLRQTCVQTIFVSSYTDLKSREAVSNLSDTSLVNVALLSPYELTSFLARASAKSISESQDFHIAAQHYTHPRDRNVAIFHSSGTTGTPKAIYHSHAYILKYGTCAQLTDEECIGLNLSTLPVYHGYGLIGPMLSLTIGKPVCWHASNTIPTGESVAALLEALPIRSIMTVPAILEELANLEAEKGPMALARLDFVASGGGSLKQSVGDKLSSFGVPILNSFGITEIGGLTVMYVPQVKHDWRYFRMRDDIGLKFTQDPADPSKYQLAATPPGWETEHVARDVLERKPDNWDLDFKGVARSDGLIVLATGQKFAPNALEARVVAAHDSIKAALVFGDERVEIGWLIEPAVSISKEETSHFQAKIWNVIAAVQSHETNFAKVWTPDLVLITSPNRRLPRSDKGSIMRLEAYAMFKADIDHAYNCLEDDAEPDLEIGLDAGDLGAGVRNCVSRFIDLPATSDNDTDLFELGLDSTLSFQLRRHLSARRPFRNMSLSSNFLYEFPTINKITTALVQSGTAFPPSSMLLDITQVENLVSDYSRIPVIDSAMDGASILLLGSTGSLGSHVLAVLTAIPQIRHIYFLTRKQCTASTQHHLKSLQNKRVTLSSTQAEKVEIIETDSSAPFLGLPTAIYQKLLSTVTHVLDCAWSMNFNLRPESFRAHYLTLQNLLAFMSYSREAQQHRFPRLLFVSSIAVIRQCARFHDRRLALEKPVYWDDITFDLGYGQAKLVCELILQRAAKGNLPFSIAVARVGQISGSTETGFWNTSEHIPALFKISKDVGALPHLPDTFSWIPVDTAAKVVSDLLLATESEKFAVYHVENPKRQNWSEVVDIFKHELSLPGAGLVEYEEWLRLMDERDKRRYHANGGQPAAELAQFFKTHFRPAGGTEVILDTTRAERHSRALRDCQPVHEPVIRKYFQYFRNCGFIH